MISRFFFPQPLPAEGEIPLPDAIAHHAFRVLRLRDGAPAVLFDGSGDEVSARLIARGKGGVALLSERHAVGRESPLELVLVQALASGEKMDWIVQKAVELGVSTVIPVQAERSVLRLAAERATKRVEHWRQVAIAACEQSGRNRVPAIEPIVGLREYLARDGNARRLVLSPVGGVRVATLSRPDAALHLLIGPEGGWSDEEFALCQRAGCTAIGLGPRVLRAETAGLAAVAALQTLWGDF
ncbi:MAG: 16S rRNA (uracil(1498)-N(3))-methyltransferase [Aromatoleum sp.]|jgi:16S rRNA (uracil1498-N3)-methyltransferase|uniref:16S rRNA (uracil(1498)-N(3))-methyltransferase n=1 Tax=Aromatoleum sp. TaxID=2307007 RepID=UPI002894289E|nr:16S rRNA (uracil(1498)-N(3))-methyltransferase [Aromatoleum sp.]MDT3668773.1 16S rRNA (uracil(1498)-N(3))-methyltransferase [Aromatoleum sp.]